MVPWGFVTEPNNTYGYSTNVGYWPEDPDPALDERKNPVMWRTWFREFLLEKIQAAIHALIIPDGSKIVLAFRCRSAPFQEKAWKMKAWKQALA